MSRPMTTIFTSILLFLLFPICFFNREETIYCYIVSRHNIYRIYRKRSRERFIYKKAERNMSKLSDVRNEDLRKLQLTGGSTYIISLPKKWVTQNRLVKKSPLLIRIEDDGSPSFSAPALRKEEKTQEAYISATPRDTSDALIRKTVSAYLVGYTVVNIKAKNQQQMSSKQR